MKNIKLTLIIFMVCSLNFIQCVVTSKFVNVEKIIELKINASLSDVMTKLGSKPYNILLNQKDGYAIYVYKYKLIERKVSSFVINEIGGETQGANLYNPNLHYLYLYFKDNKLETIITSQGRKQSESLIIDNTNFYFLSQEKEHINNNSGQSVNSANVKDNKKTSN